jgi:hypothetical protein
MRMPGDVIFSVGVGMLALFVAKLYIGKAKREPVPAGTAAETATGR